MKNLLRFDILTLFPGFFTSPLATSLMKRAIRNQIIEVKIHDIRRFGVGKNKQVDDRPFGGGPGMVLKPDVLAAALQKVKKAQNVKEESHVILLDPAGVTLTQTKVRLLAKRGSLILICGHYEGVDERFKGLFVDEEISIGDFVLSGGEAAALVLLEATSRLLPGFLGKGESSAFESFSEFKLNKKMVKLLDYPVYTRPVNFVGKKIPSVLLSGNHQKIRQWRLRKAIEKTRKRRPDLLE